MIESTNGVESRTTISLKWEKLHSIHDFTAEQDKQHKIKGVYLWGFVDAGVFIPYYVGKSDHIYERVLQHVAGLSGGLYRVYSLSTLRTKLTQAARQNEALYIPTSVYELATRFQSRHVQNVVDELLWAFRFTYAERTQDCPCSTEGLEWLLGEHFGLSYLGSTIRSGQVEAEKYRLKCCEDSDAFMQRLLAPHASALRPIHLSVDSYS